MEEIKGIEITDVLGVAEPLNKLIECISCGVGKVYEPIHIQRMAKAKAKEIEVIGEAITKDFSLPTQYDDGKVRIDATSAEELIKRTGNRVAFQEIRRQQNIEAVIAATYKELENEKQVSKEPLNEDWLFKFFDFVGDISDEQMQLLWSKILAGEIKKPNTYSLRTLNTLRNMTQNEAKLFQKVSKFKFLYRGDSFIINDTEILKKYNCTYNELLAIEDCGLINLNGLISMTLDKEKEYIYTDKVISFIEKKMEVGIYTFSKSGKQLLNLLEEDTIYEYAMDIIRSLKKKHLNNNIKAYRIMEIKEGNIVFDEKIDLLQGSNE